MPASPGTFSGNPQAEWLVASGNATDPANRCMQLLADFWYDDPAGRRWLAPKGSVVNGASIPAALWSALGSPYTGAYRRASVVHDVACAAAAASPDPRAARRAADFMFYHACRAGGCPVFEAEWLFAGVRIGAWVPQVGLWATGGAAQPLTARARTQPAVADESVLTTFREIAADLAARKSPWPLAKLDALVEQHLAAKATQVAGPLASPAARRRRQ
ncbi:MAG: DUF1353 domain-containing protein [Janthinobacterium lividum]